MAEVTKLTLAVDSTQVRGATRDLGAFAAKGKQTETAANNVTRSFKGLGAAASAVAGSFVVRAIIEAADGYKNLNARLQLVSKSTSEFARAQSEVLDISQRTRTGLESTASLYTSLSRSTQSLGVSQDDLLSVTESINQALIVSGTSAQGAQAALVQLGQGFAAGALRGEELNSVLEQAPRLAQAIADGLGVPIGKLRELGKDGELTAEKVFAALQKSGAQLQAEFNRIPITVAGASTQAANSLSVLIGALDQSTGATSALAGGISSVAEIVKELATEIQRASKGAEDVGFLARAFTTVSQTVKILFSDVAFVFQGIGREIGGISAQLVALAKLDFDGFTAISDAMKADAARARAELDKYQFQVLNPFLTGRGRGTTGGADPRLIGTTPANETVGFRPPAVAKPDKPKKGRGSEQTFTSYSEQITQDVGRLLEGSDVTQAKIYADTLKQLDDLYFNNGLSAELYESALKKLTGATSSAEIEASKFIAEQERLAELLAATESAGIEKQREDMALLAKALEDGVIKEGQYLEAVSARLDLVAEKTKEAKDFADELGLSFASAFEDAIVRGNKFSDVLKGLAEDITRLIVRKQVTEPLANAVGGLNIGGFISGLFGGGGASVGTATGADLDLFFNAKGGAYNSAGLSAYSGQIVNKPTLFPFARGAGIMGEAGPEAILPLQRGADGRLGVSAGAGGGVTVNVINQGGTGLAVQGQTQRQGADGGLTIDVIVRAVEAGMADNVANRSGPLSRALEGGYGLRPSME